MEGRSGTPYRERDFPLERPEKFTSKTPFLPLRGHALHSFKFLEFLIPREWDKIGRRVKAQMSKHGTYHQWLLFGGECASLI